VLNNGMNDFSVENNFFGLPQSAANKIEPHKRAMSRIKGSVVTAITRNATAIYANADYRKRGGVAGF